MSTIAKRGEGISIRPSFTVLPQTTKWLLLVGAIFVLNIFSAQAALLKVTLSDIVFSGALLGGDYPAFGSFIYDTKENKILSDDIATDMPGVGPFGDSDTIFGASVSTFGDPNTIWPSFSFLNIYHLFPGIDPPEDGCHASAGFGLLTFLCLTPSEPVTKPGQHVELAFSYGEAVSLTAS